jgi:hypothetical protein
MNLKGDEEKRERDAKGRENSSNCPFNIKERPFKLQFFFLLLYSHL